MPSTSGILERLASPLTNELNPQYTTNRDSLCSDRQSTVVYGMENSWAPSSTTTGAVPGRGRKYFTLASNKWLNDSVMRENTKCDGHSHFDKWLALSLGDICLLPRSSITLLKEGERSRERTVRWREVQIEEPYPNICHLWRFKKNKKNKFWSKHFFLLQKVTNRQYITYIRLVS